MIGKVILWLNGMVMVFDEVGDQLPEYQGKYTDVKEKILQDATPDTEFCFGKWGDVNIEVGREHWSRNQFGIYPDEASK